jgi:hypothetical protein
MGLAGRILSNNPIDPKELTVIANEWGSDPFEGSLVRWTTDVYKLPTEPSLNFFVNHETSIVACVILAETSESAYAKMPPALAESKRKMDFFMQWPTCSKQNREIASPHR